MDRFQITKIDDGHSNADGGAVASNPVVDTAAIKRKESITAKAFNFLRRGSRAPQQTEEARKYSLAQLTREALPRLDNYRISKRALKRPSMTTLHGEEADNQQDGQADQNDTAPGHVGHKLGWIEGVVIPCLLNIWGVMLFLRLSWVVAQSGIIQAFVIIGISAVVCVITTLSLSAISTNGEVKGGGVYFIISRSLGPEFGASVGIVFALANAVAASMNTIGFCDSLNDLLRSYDLKIIDGGVNDTRIVGVITIFILICICCVGMEWEAKAQNFLLVTIVAAIFNFLIGTAIGPNSDEQIAKGFVGFNKDTFVENLGPDYRFSEKVQQNFFSVFSIFFPSVTGIQAGANISGDLKDPAGAIPKGTLLALLLSMVSYATFVFFAGGAALRDAPGNLTDLVNGTLVGVNFDCKTDKTCGYGLHNSYSVMQLMSVWGPLIYAGCFAATLSTALTNLLSVPRLVQALGVDRIYPGLIFFSKAYGKTGEPYRGYVLTFFISAGFVLLAELNVIAPLISTFYLASYALINFCTFHAGFVKPLGWRPTFRFYNVWLSLAGFIMCVAIMFLIDWVSSLITFVIIFALYLVVVYRKPDVNWGSSTQAQMYKTALNAAQRLQGVSDHVKNYRPQILVLAGSPQSRPPLIDLANLITKNSSLMIVGKIVPLKMSYKSRQALIKESQKYLAAKKTKAFYSLLDGFSFQDGVRALVKASGFGKFTPNILLMGFKSDWRTCRKEDLIAYFNVLHGAFSNRMGVAILRLRDGLDFSDINHVIQTPGPNGHTNVAYADSLSTINTVGLENSQPLALRVPKTSELFHVDSNLNLAGMVSATSSITVPQEPPLPNQQTLRHSLNLPSAENIVYSTVGGSAVPRDILDALNVFSKKQTKGTIDVWWLYDDGGLTMLLPYIISMRSTWSNCKLRVFALTNRRMELELEERNMANLLGKLRIQFSDLTMVQGVTEPPKRTTIAEHEATLNGFHEGENTECFVYETEKLTLREKTYRQLRLHEMVVEHSKNANLIVMSLPMPRQEAVSAPLYMSWLEMLTKDLPPFILVRGNQTPVLTFYS